MKAVIMAGGKGTRLQPLTNRMPKPMVPLLERPCMEYVVELLQAHGIFEIAVTLQYLPEVIKQHFGDGSAHGVRLHYFEEATPLGTAGSVKNASDFLDETFLVISGDALTDFDLTQAIHFHRETGALGTLMLSQADDPTRFGVVTTDAAGRIVRFQEKPTEEDVCSDTVNTGIYVLEPKLLDLCESGVAYDFGKQLFPRALEQGLPLYGYRGQGYWSDIGTPDQYRETQVDMIYGRVQVDLKLASQTG